ncbi:PRP38 family-domain-containing protein [Mycena rebaudengoi]|nr:PRP38 family-domain-containing protein [Mycena rebaudengoi]
MIFVPESIYWKEHCLTAESPIDKALEVGGVYGNQRPTEFLCLLQIQLEKGILVKYLRADEIKSLPMTFRAVHVLELLELLLKDYRKLRLGTYMDELIDQLLTEERVCDIILPRYKTQHSGRKWGNRTAPEPTVGCTGEQERA